MTRTVFPACRAEPWTVLSSMRVNIGTPLDQPIIVSAEYLQYLSKSFRVYAIQLFDFFKYAIARRGTAIGFSL